MKHLLLVSSMLAGLAMAPAAFAQAPGYTTPKTSWGVPELSGFWTNQSYTQMSRPPKATKLVVSVMEEQELLKHNVYEKVAADEAGASDVSEEGSKKLLSDANPSRGYNKFWFEVGQQFGRVKGEIRTSWVVDPPNGMVPYKKEYAASRNFGNDYTSYETRPLAERCLRGFTNGAGPVLANGLYNNNYQIVQSPGNVVILGEMIHDARVIPIVASKADVKHGSSVLEKWSGDSVGWYEGNTLVVETINLNPKQNTYGSAAGKVTERFTRWDDKQIFYEFTVEDPTMFTQAWKGEMSLNANDKPPFEYACHEGNYGLHGILAGARRFEADGIPQQIRKPTFGDLEDEG